RSGKARFDHVDAHALELARDPQLLLPGHRRTWALLAVAHRRVEYDQFLFCHDALRSVMSAAARAAEDGWAGPRADVAAPEMKLPTAMCGKCYAPRGRSSRPAGRMPVERSGACAKRCMRGLYRHSVRMASNQWPVSGAVMPATDYWLLAGGVRA